MTSRRREVEVYQPQLDPVGGNLLVSALVALLPLLTIFVTLGLMKWKAHWAGLAALAVSIIVAVVAYGMRIDLALLSATEGAVFGLYPIMWIVFAAIWLYELTVISGRFEDLRATFGLISDDPRIQAIIIAFCFGALLEALAGFGTPVAITVVMLVSLGFRPLKAAVVSLLANTAPVAFGALATPIVTLATVASGASNDPRLTIDTIGAMVGRQTPLLALIVPLFLVIAVDGGRGARQTWPAALTAGVAFGGAQFVASNFISVQLADIFASLVSAAAVVVLTRVWSPSHELTAEAAEVDTAETATTGALHREPSGAGAGVGGAGGT
ncbi:MAG: L-lactate permease, partial [Actinomycetes bacterium]